MTTQRTTYKRNGAVTTTDAATVTTVVASGTIPDSSVGLVWCSLVGRDTGTGNVASTEAVVSIRRQSGTLTILTPVNLLTFVAGSDAGLSTCALTIDASSNTVRMRVQGVASTTIDWLGIMEILSN